jgi:hypothetical protein
MSEFSFWNNALTNMAEMGSPSADAQRRSLERGLGGRLGARRSCIGRPSHPSSAAQQQFVVAHSQLSFCIYTLPPLPSANTVTDSL